MLTLPLEPTDDRADPVFKDAASCKQWLDKLQLTNMQLAHSLLLTEINELNRFPMRGLERLDTLELLRDTVEYVQDEYVKKLAAKPLPFKEHELIIFFAIVQLWQAMALGYQRCLQAQTAGDKQLAKRGTLLCHRAMHYGGRAIFEHLRAGYEIDGKLWRQLHSLYAYAEAQNLLSPKLSDPLDKNQAPASCHDLYLKILLTEYARPAELSRAQLGLLDSWLTRWTDILTVARGYTSSKGDAPPLALDLNDAQHGLRLAKTVKPGESVRYLAMVPLSKLMRVKTILLQQGKTPPQVDLGEAADSRECMTLLNFLHQSWCEDRDKNFVAVNQRAQLCFTPANIYAQLTGSAPPQPVKSAEESSEARKQIETFGRVLQEAPDRKAAGAASSLETWLIDKENIQGAQLTRADASGAQLSRNQLIALRRSDAEAFALAVATWAKVLRTGQLRIGARYLPGKAEAVSLHALGADREILTKPATAFLLEAVPALKIPSSLIVPRGWFKAGRVAEMSSQHTGKKNITMGFSVEQGGDFERISFKPDDK